jgi:hypothetical protein
MKSSKISTCANPQCEARFNRLGEGKLFVRRAEKDEKEASQEARWLCPGCAQRFDLRYDRQKEEYVLIKLGRVA